MTTTTEIARAHGYNGPTNCQDCGTTENVHFGSWYDPKTGESGNFLRCCACDIKAGAKLIDHADCGAPITEFVINEYGNPYSQLAHKRIHARAVEAYSRGHHDAAHYLNLEGQAAHEHALSAVLAEVGRSYAAAAINQVVHTLANKLDEDTFTALGDIATTLDLEVVEDLDGANGTGEDEAGPEVRVFHRADGWVFSFEPGKQPCTINRVPESEGRQSCSATAVWKLVQHRPGPHSQHLV
ncbi:hypothetical protein [Streptomyces sp. RPT161]|uniref:hypothetical protein n=1 Tax=Streptomyces sp. RPT161 TaxID=3015993 RepID=UPI0022B85EEF|nr:hypothetical protein [Streptomyces sp. RPT161]